MDVNQDINPYAAPSATEPLPTPAEAKSFFRKQTVVQIAWFLAVVINLPVPLMFGFSFTAMGAARVGMMIGIAFIYGIGVSVCQQRADAMWRLIVGSVLTALSQFWPILHMLVGMIAMAISKFLCDADRETDQINSLLEVILTTVLTGVGLIIPSLVMGLIIILLFRIRAFDED